MGSQVALREIGADLRAVGSCSMPEKNYDGSWKNVGCQSYETCELLKRFKAKFGDDSPHNGGIRMVKETLSGMKVVHWKDSCYGYNARLEEKEMKGIAYDWVADEGDNFKELGSTFRDETVPGEGLKRFIDDKVIGADPDHPNIIPAFPKPKDNPKLLGQAFARQIAQDHAEDRKRQRSDRIIDLAEQAQAQAQGKKK